MKQIFNLDAQYKNLYLCVRQKVNLYYVYHYLKGQQKNKIGMGTLLASRDGNKKKGQSQL